MNIKRFLLAFIISLPITFSVIFFGYLPFHFDAVVYTDNIVGEGTCSSYLTNLEKSFSYLYKADAYFGSELKTLKLRDLQYNVTSVNLFMYDIEEVDILSFDISVFGRTVAHLNKDGLSHPYSKTVSTAVLSDEEPLVHLDRTEEEASLSIGFPGSSIIPLGVWIAYFAFIVLLALILSLGLSFLMKRFSIIKNPLLSASAIMLTVIMGCYLCGSLPYVNYTDLLLNWLILFAVALLIQSFTIPWIGTVVVSVFTLVWYIANHFVILFRSKPIMPADLKAMRTAKEVVGGYDLTPTLQIAVSIVVVLLYLTLVVVVWKKNQKKDKESVKGQLIKRGVGVIIAIGMMLFSVNNPAFRQLNTFQWDAKVLEGFHREGIVLTFVKSAMSAHVERPEGYSLEVVDSYLSEYQTDTQSGGIQPTRIIMVMNEAFSDLRTVGLDETIDFMPYIDGLDKDTIEGSLYVSVIGGGTCNTEFEALTGNTLAFLASGAYPYTENITAPLFSLASYFEKKGYATEAFHANKPQNWNRNIVYPNLGFEVFHSILDYPELTGENYLHSYVTDATDFGFMGRRDEEIGETPRFLFNVTIQNHADYDHFEDVKEAETLKPYEESLHQNVRVYLSLLKVSDDSVHDLIERYRNSDEPTMIIFFGDHQPMLPAAAQEDVYTQMQVYLDYFKSKFFIWTNYETETEYDMAISANFLPWLILERGNFPMPPYVQMLKEVHEKYPIISSQGVVDAEGNVYDNIAVLLDDPLIRKYQYVQYANLFDEIDPAWFEIPEYVQ